MAYQEVVARRRRAVKHYLDPATGLRRAVVGIADLHYQDDQGQWQDIDESFEADSGGFTWRAARLRHMLRSADDGGRRWYPRRGVTTEYVTLSRPEVWAQALGRWVNLPLLTPTRQGNQLIWDRPNHQLRLTVDWKSVKLDLVLKNSQVPGRVRWPMTLTGLVWDNWQLRSSVTGEIVGVLPYPTAVDANGADVPIEAVYDGAYVEYDVDLSQAVYPVTVDPTFTSQPDNADGIDTFLQQNGPNNNWGNSATVDIASTNNAVRAILLKFDVSSLVGAMVSAATLYLYNESTATNQKDMTLNSILVANSAWTENGATWNYAVHNATRWAGDSGGDGGGDAGCSVSGTDYNSSALGTFSYLANSPADTEHAVSLDTTQVQAWIDTGNYGFTIRSTGNTGILSWHASDYATDATKRPKLVIDYTSGGGGTTYNVSVGGTITPAGALIRQPQQGLTGSVTPAGALTRLTGKLAAGTVTPAGTLIRETQQALSGSVAPAGSLASQAQKGLTGQVAPAGVLTRQTQQNVSGTVTPDGALTRETRKTLAGSVTPSGALTAIKTVLLTLVGSLTPVGTLANEVRQHLAGQVAAAGVLTKQVQQALSGSITPSGALTAIKTILISLAGTITPAGALAALVQKGLAGSVAPVGTLVKQVQQGLAGSVAPAGTLTRATHKTLTGSVIPAGALATIRAALLSLAGQVAPVGALTKQIQAGLVGSITPTGGLLKQVQQALTGTITPTGVVVAVLVGASGAAVKAMFKGMFKGMFRGMV